MSFQGHYPFFSFLSELIMQSYLRFQCKWSSWASTPTPIYYLWKFAHINKVYIINGKACFVLSLKTIRAFLLGTKVNYFMNNIPLILQWVFWRYEIFTFYSLFEAYYIYSSDNVSLELVYIGWDFGECQCDNFKSTLDYNLS